MQTVFPTKKLLRLAEARLAAGMSQEDMALRLGISQTLLSMYETGVKDIPISKFYAIALLLGVHPGTLFPHEPGSTPDGR